MTITGGKLNNENMNERGAALTAGALSKAFEQAGVHPTLMSHLHGSGFFGTLFEGIKKGTKFLLDNKDTIVNVGKAGFDAYKKSKGGALMAVSSKAKRPQTAWNKLVTKIAKQQKCNVREAIKYIKENNLY